MEETNSMSIPATFAQLSKLIYNDIEKSTTRSSIMTKYTKEQIVRFLENPLSSQKELRKLSNYLYNVSPNYKRVILYFANIMRFDYIVEPYDINVNNFDRVKFEKQYMATLKIIENMNLSHEMQKVFKTCFREDVFYGYEHMTADAYFIQKLNSDYCRISSIEDGVFNFEYDFSFFDNKDNSVAKYAPEFQEKYTKYQSNKSKFRWQELKAEKTICMKVNDDIDYPIPPLNSVFEALFDIEETKRMSTIKSKMDNYMILTQQIPIDDKKSEANQFLIDLDTAIAFHNKATESLPDEVGLITSPMKIEAIKLERRKTDVDEVAKSERAYYAAAGVSQLLFNGNSTTSTSLSKSVITDEQIAFALLKQVERWLNRKLKYINKSFKFRVKFLETTDFNHAEVTDRYLKAAQYGVPVIQELAASLGLSPSALINKTFLQNEILNLPIKLIPLSSSHTQSGDSTSNGAPTKSDDDLSESGEQTRENEGNIRE